MEDGGILFQSDLYFGGPGPDAVALAQVVGGHGGVLPFDGLMALLDAE